MHCFVKPVSTSVFTRSCRLPAVSARRRTNTFSKNRVVPNAQMSRSPWPVGRFLSNFFFYTPLGKALRGKPTTPNMTGKASDGDVLVTGAAGGTGRRVVATLLSCGRNVRALTRSRERLVAALREIGVDVTGEERKGRLRILVSDLYNVPQDALFGISAVIGCTGTKTGPVDDDNKRSKYMQGIVFYPPVILEDTPKNVELLGVQRIAKLLSEELDSVSGTNSGPQMFDFNDIDAARRTWGALDDVVMGGVSKSGVRVERGALIFSGDVSTNNSGGFVSTRTVDFDDDVDLSAFDGVQIRVRGDGNRYKFILRCERKWDGYAQSFSFDTVRNEWIVVNAPFSEFKTVFRGRSDRNAPRVDPAHVVAVQLMLSKFEYDGDLNPSFTPGSFSLTVASICPFSYVDETNKTKTPRFVHLSSAAVTRPQRLDEVRGTDADVPILQLNEKIGRLLDWKLAGEDAIRTTGLPYTIVRSCALTVDDAKGIDQLIFDQGDLMNGRVSRDDMAQLLVQALDCPQLVDKTFEVATVDDDRKSPETSLEEKASRLEADSDNQRTFGPFPYVPKENALVNS